MAEKVTIVDYDLPAGVLECTGTTGNAMKRWIGKRRSTEDDRVLDLFAGRAPVEDIAFLLQAGQLGLRQQQQS